MQPPIISCIVMMVFLLTVQFLVNVGTRASVLEALDQAVGKHIEAHENDFSPGHSVQLVACGDPLKVALNVGYEFAHNAVDGAKTGQARSDLLQLVSDTLVELGVVHTQAPVLPFNDPHPHGDAAQQHTVLPNPYC